MIFLSNVMLGIASVLGVFFWIFYLAFAVVAISSWFNLPPNSMAVQLGYTFTEPLVRPLRRFCKPFAGFDTAFFGAVIMLIVLDALVVDNLRDYAYLLKSQAYRG